LVFCRDYLEFIFIRNYLWKKIIPKKICLLTFHEYLNNSKNDKRKHLSEKGFKKIILMTERFYFFNRFPALNVETIFFFSKPIDNEYFFEICKFLDEDKKIKNIFSIQNNQKKTLK